MVLEFQTLGSREIEAEEEPIPDPRLSTEEADEQYGKFVVEPLENGFGMTLGNPMRRALYSSLPGTAVTWVKIDGVLHEYATIPHVREEVAEFLLNVKGIRLRSEVDRPGRLRLEVSGAGEVSAGDIMASSDFQIINPDLHLATLDSNEAKLSVELNVERGVGYRVAAEGDGLPIGVLPVDAVFSPIRKVNYHVQPTRVGQRTDFERLVLEVWTDGTVTPVEAMKQASSNLIKHFFLFNATQTGEDGEEITPIALQISPEQYNLPVERLDLSSRTLNCLKRAGIDKVGQVLEMKKSELLQIRNFGEKSMTELYDRLAEMDLLPEDAGEDTGEPAEGEEESKDE
ncbi:MAG: DNA-directed RNA polymerase subunit alpha [Chloroflexi bacterium]|nr:DNA-directed RNA polymerase subunit alpha [Chloroflexota bacterium]